MTQCKSCGNAMTESAATTSIFRLSFLPVRGKKTDRHTTTKLAEKIGPLCLTCIEKITDLATEAEV